MRIKENIFKRTQSMLSVLRLVWDCKPRLVVIIFILTIVSSLIPFAQTVIAKYVLDSIIAAVASKGAWADMRRKTDTGTRRSGEMENRR